MSQPDMIKIGEDLNVPIINAFLDGQAVPPFDQQVPASVCDHRGAGWSSDIGLNCPHCGAPMFLPPRFLAHKTVDEIESMYGLWRIAGCPPWYPQSALAPASWGIVPQYWRIAADVPGFAALGGLPVSNRLWAEFELARLEFPL